MDRQEHICPICRRWFTLESNMKIHIRETHLDNRPYSCNVCSKSFKRRTHLQSHMRSQHATNLTVSSTSSSPPRAMNLTAPSTSSTPHAMNLTAPSTSSAAVPPAPSTSAETGESPRKRRRDSSLTPSPNPTTWRLDTVEDEERLLNCLPLELRAIYREHWASIRTHTREGRNVTVLTVCWDPTTASPQWNGPLLDLFHRQTVRFKVDFSHSFILRHKETGEFSYYHASANNHSALEHPRLISSKPDFLRFLESLNDHDLLESVRNERPTSAFSVAAIPSTSFYFYHLQDFPIGCYRESLPSFISRNPNLHTLQRAPGSRAEPYRDNLCFFRCIALYKGYSIRALDKPAKAEFHEWRATLSSKVAPQPLSEFAGVTLNHLAGLERYYSINIDVFEFKTLDTKPDPVLVPLRRSAYDYDYTNTLRLLCYEQHFLYIVDIDKLGHALACEKCDKLWKTQKALDRHQRTCTALGSKMFYPGGVYSPRLSVLKELEKLELDVDPSFIFPFRATFDFEVYFDTTNLPENTSSTSYTARHVPLSVSVASNIPEFEAPYCIVSDGDPAVLVRSMLMYLEQLSERSYTILRKDFSDVFKELNKLYREQEAGSLDVDVDIGNLIGRFITYLHQLPVVGFNSSKYDLNVIKPYILQTLGRIGHLDHNDYIEAEDDDDDDRSEGRGELFVVKRNQEYLCLSNRKLLFLDIRNFLAPGFSYSKYLQAFDVSEKKSFFPYEYIDSLERLKETQLPPHEVFFSKLKNSNITDEDYQHCQRIWSTHNMKTLRDFLIHYNNTDVGPFLTALDRQIKVYAGLKVDLLKDGLSVPGITLKFLFSTIPPDTIFTLFHNNEGWLHTLLRDNMTGGPSIIFHRYHEKGKTFIRNRSDKSVESIQGYDANALYLWAVTQDMPTEYPTIRRVEDGFRPKRRDMFGRKAREWLAYTAHTQGIRIQHQHNGREKQLGDRHIRVDGYDEMSRTAYQFHGCLWHGHDCHNTIGYTTHPYNDTPLDQLRTKTDSITKYLREEVKVNVIEMWECEWDDKRDDPEVIALVQQLLPPVRRSNYYDTSLRHERGILRAIESGRLFGLVQCDVNVPEPLREHFGEFQPIFKNVSVSRDDIGAHMREYAERHKLLPRPRKTLVGSYFGTQLLLATPLLQWYMSHGCLVHNVTLVIEYTPNPCFQLFGTLVSDARRAGDRDPTKKILAETYKLLGNAAYGKTLTNVAKHREFHYKDSAAASSLVNDVRFRKLMELNDDFVEVELAKKYIKWDLPLQIGFFVYQYAKLRMLQFHYDFIDKYIDRSDYQLLEMDTDSLYLAFSTPSLEDAVKPSLREQFYREWEQWLPACACPMHKQQFIDLRVAGHPFDSTQCERCQRQQLHDKRTPGLFKTEYSGDGFIGLCSKTYYCFGEVGGDKLSSKGLNKHQNTLTKASYLDVIRTQKCGGGVNRGFRTDGKTVYTYSQHRASLSYLYIKRIVDADGVTTHPTLV